MIRITLPEMCKTHQSLLVHQAKYKESDPWQLLVVAGQIALFQAVSVDDYAHEKMGGNIENISVLGCLACFKPDVFGELVEVAKSHKIPDIKKFGESFVDKADKLKKNDA